MGFAILLMLFSLQLREVFRVIEETEVEVTMLEPAKLPDLVMDVDGLTFHGQPITLEELNPLLQPGQTYRVMAMPDVTWDRYRELQELFQSQGVYSILMDVGSASQSRKDERTVPSGEAGTESPDRVNPLTGWVRSQGLRKFLERLFAHVERNPSAVHAHIRLGNIGRAPTGTLIQRNQTYAGCSGILNSL